MGIIRAAGRSTPVPKQSRSSKPMVVQPPEIKETDTATVACEGIGGALGHPRVFLAIGEEGFVDCPYCDRRFVLKDGATAGGVPSHAAGVYSDGAG
jgi:uncharacterized Zn-finger protein